MPDAGVAVLDIEDAAIGVFDMEDPGAECFDMEDGSCIASCATAGHTASGASKARLASVKRKDISCSIVSASATIADMSFFAVAVTAVTGHRPVTSR